jgi:hypothetical protein
VALAAAVAVIGAPPAPARKAGERHHQAKLFRVLLLSQGRLLVSVRRPARVSVFVGGHRIDRVRARRGQVYELPVHRPGRIRVLAVAGRARQTVFFRVR